MYNYVIIVTCVAFQNGFMATQALGYIMFDIYIYIYIYIYIIYMYIYVLFDTKSEKHF